MTAARQRLDYRPPDYRVEEVVLHVSLQQGCAQVATLARYHRTPEASPDAPLWLDGRDLELTKLELDGAPLDASRFERHASGLLIHRPPPSFELRTEVQFDPDANTALEGLYRSGRMLCTQCEAHGFSRITYYPDRPDVLARFRVRIEAPRQQFPVLLANGNLIDSGSLPEGRHYAVWDDPFPKPCYLFALVAGDLVEVNDVHVTASGRKVQLRFFVDPGNEDRVAHAIASLKNAMRWDEDTYGLEYDLDTYMVVAARDFNMGAMENKGLNLFNAAYVLASPETATDDDYDSIEAVIGHEYFHNWTGNRVTCRDWFQLSLKEGLTVFREQQFAAAMASPAARRIGDVRVLRARQFPEDAGPMAHPVRPEQYVEVNNFYTPTVYEKGAEIIRMIETLVGPQRFIEGVRAYLRRHDGQAATIEDFLAAQEAVSGLSLDGFRRWYSQAGTPVVTVRDRYDAPKRRYTLQLRQHTPSTPGQADKQPLPIPIRFGLRNAQGQDLPVGGGRSFVRPDLILLEDADLEVSFDNLDAAPIPQFLHGFSAPVRLDYPWRLEQLQLTLLHAEDAFLRWEAVQELLLAAFRESLETRQEGAVAALCSAMQRVASNPPEDKALVAELLRLPSTAYFIEALPGIEPLAAARVRNHLRGTIARALTGPLSVWAEWAPEGSGARAAATRALANLALYYLAATGAESVFELCRRRVWQTRSMTLVQGALVALNDFACPQREAAFEHFHERWRGEALVLDKWFALEAASAAGEPLRRVQSLVANKAFDVRNPNRVRAVLGTFARDNVEGFHAPDGSGYVLLADWIARLDAGNPQLAARLCDPLLGWRRYPQPHAARMRAALQMLSDKIHSPDVREKVDKALVD